MDEILSFASIPLLLQGCTSFRELQMKLISGETLNRDDICKLNNLSQNFCDLFQIVSDGQVSELYISQKTLLFLSIIEKYIPELQDKMPLIYEIRDKGIF